MRPRPTIAEIEAKKMSDKDRLIALINNKPDFDSQSEEIQYHMRIGQLLGAVDAKQRLPINESLLLANGFEKHEGLGDYTYYLFELKTPPILGEPQVITHISVHHFDSDAHYTLYARNTLTIYNRIEVRVNKIQQAEDAINAVGFPFSFSLKGYKADEPRP